MRKILASLVLIVFIFGFTFLGGEELPKPTYDNSLLFSWTHNFLHDETDVPYLVGQYGNGLYAKLFFSSFVYVDMDWRVDINSIDTEIQAFKDKVSDMITFAKKYNVGIHLTLVYGISRGVTYYNDAKAEDVRNAQWYNDNNISSSSQQSRFARSNQAGGQNSNYLDLNHADDDLDYTPRLSGSSADSSILNDYVFNTFSRYARKLRGHLEAKVEAIFSYLKRKQEANPDVVIIVSAPGESEMNFHRTNHSTPIQDYFCDYSPFSVMEFRDWVRHEGLYAAGEKYDGQGYSKGGSRYQGGSGLSNFNSDFGTSFTTWDLKYYNWSLTDAIDQDYTNVTNPDPKAILISKYSYNGMKPSSGSNYKSGGFDPPRVMQEVGANDFYDLWHTFRETQVANYVKDMTNIARQSGFPRDQYFTHQIPGDHLFGTRPNDPAIPVLNSRYFASASPLWTADPYSDTGVGLTIYDINWGSYYSRTSKYAPTTAKSLSDNWAALEYNPESIPDGYLSSVSLGSVSTIYDQMMKLYNANPHVISFFKWTDKSVFPYNYQFKGTNRETAAKQFFNVVRDKARQSSSTVFTPRKVSSFSGAYSNTTGLVKLDWSEKIWSDLSHQWTHWGDFKTFVVYRSTSSSFTANSSTEVARTTSAGYTDTTFPRGTTVYYKVAAMNSKGETGPVTSTIAVATPDGVPIPSLSVSRDRLNFVQIVGAAAAPTQEFRISNTAAGMLNWTATDTADWLTCTPASGSGGGVVTVSVDASALAQGSYSATITVADPLATNSPHTIAVYLAVKASNQNQMPQASFDTPVDGSTVSSSIAVTGWAVDDVGVQSVKIYRAPAAGEGSGLIYIGDANFVEGARPDLETAFPDYPANYKGGWGYMLLTNFLPVKGNGTHKLYAVITDSLGKQLTMGPKTIICDNANAVRPFGAIDTPTQGGTASGSSFLNWGWALTPQPNSIPIDGSSIKVVVDGVNIGSPKYNLFKEDIANFFPGYANSNGAVGYFILDTTQFTDGVHIIQWTATDSGNNTDGIGSRFFTVQNSGSSRSASASIANTKVIPQTSHRHITDAATLKKIPLDHSNSLRFSKGYQQQLKRPTPTNNKSNITTFEIREMERITIDLGSSARSGCLLNNNKPQALPIGSTLDSKNGKFYWLPGPGHLGKYTLDFVVNGHTPGIVVRKQFVIDIKPKHQ